MNYEVLFIEILPCCVLILSHYILYIYTEFSIFLDAGIFVVPHNDSYMFMIAGDDAASLLVDCEGKKDNLVHGIISIVCFVYFLYPCFFLYQTKMAYTTSHSNTFDRYASQKSDWMSLEEGKWS